VTFKTLLMNCASPLVLAAAGVLEPRKAPPVDTTPGEPVYDLARPGAAMAGNIYTVRK